MEAVQLQLFNTLQKSVEQKSSAIQLSDVFNYEYISGWPDIFGMNLFRWASTNVVRPIKTLSLFSGGGGLDIGFHDAGFSILEMVEIDERFVACLLYTSPSPRDPE